MQIRKKQIQNDAVGAAKILLENNSWLRGRNAADNADVNIMRLNAGNVIEFGAIPQATGTPSNNNDLATVAFVKQLAAGLRDPKDAVRAATTENITLATAPATIDGVTLVNGDRVLVKNQTSAAENGIYIFNGTGEAMTRAPDADSSEEVTQGFSTMVVEGTDNQRTGWLLSNQDPITLDTTALTFVQVPIMDQILFGKENITLDSTDISNGYVDLAQLVRAGSLNLSFGGVLQEEGIDYTLSEVGGVTRVTFDGDLEEGGAAELEEGDKINLQYAY